MGGKKEIQAGNPVGLFTVADGEFPLNHESVERTFAGKVVLITGGSRDVGAGIVRQLAERGATIIAGYNNKSKRADAVAREIAPFGNPFEFVPGDITTPPGVQALIDAADRIAPQKPDEEGQIDFLILNAASGTRELNVFANNALIDAALPRMRKGGKIVYMQSSPGHHNSILAPIGLIPPVYEKVAETKDEAERSIEARLAELQGKGVSLIRLIAPAVPESSNVRMFKARDPEGEAKFGEISQKLGIPYAISIDELSKVVANLLARDTGQDYLELFGPYLDGRHVLKSIYGEPAIYVDIKNIEEGIGRMIVTPDRAGRQDEIVLNNTSSDGQTVVATFQVEKRHAEGHFTKESGLPLILPGHKHIRLAVETMKTLFNPLDSLNKESYFRPIGFEQVTFMAPIKPGEVVTIETIPTEQDGAVFHQANVRVLVNGEVRTEIAGLTVGRFKKPEQNLLLEDQVIEFAAQSAGIDIFATQPDKRPLFGSIGRTRFAGVDITRGMSLQAIQHDVKTDGKRGFVASSRILDQDGSLIAEITNMQAIIASQALLKRALGV